MAPVAPAGTHPDTLGELKAVEKSDWSLAADLGFAGLRRGQVWALQLLGGNAGFPPPPANVESSSAVKTSTSPSSVFSLVFFGTPGKLRQSDVTSLKLQEALVRQHFLLN